VDLGGVRKAISVELVDAVCCGDYVIVHVGYALARLDPEEAAQTLALMREAGIDTGREFAPPMKYVDEFRDGEMARGLAAAIAREVCRPVGATPSWSSAVATLMPSPAMEWLICCPPVCAWSMAPAARCACCPLAASIRRSSLALDRRASTVCTYGDTLRVPASGGLFDAAGPGRGR
jgi:hydrogenase assembly chaperone HypC/HupF